MSELFKRFKLAREHTGLSQKEFGEKTDMSQRDISQLENGKKVFLKLSYIQFLNESGVNLNWLISGKGEKFLNSNTTTEEKASTTNMGLVDQLLKSKDDHIETLKKDKERLLEELAALKGDDGQKMVG